jgi:hypothetical protein
MEWVIVRFSRTRDVFINDRRVGVTNRILASFAGPQVIDLGAGGGYTPPRKKVTLKGTIREDPAIILFGET